MPGRRSELVLAGEGTALRGGSVPAVAILPVRVVTAVMLAAAVLAAGVPLGVFVVAASGVGVKPELPGRERRGGIVRVPLHTAVNLDIRAGQRGARAAANAAANQGVDAARREKPGERAVAASVGGDNLACGDRAVFNGEQLERGRVPEMLKYLTVLICCCKNHLFCRLSA